MDPGTPGAARCDLGLLHAALQLVPNQILLPVLEQAGALGAASTTLYLFDYSGTMLRASDDLVPPLVINDSLGGRSFATQQLMTGPAGDGDLMVWVPVTERAQRLGVLGLRLPGPATGEDLDDSIRSRFADLGLAAALLIVTAMPYGDHFHRQRRSRPLALAAEMQWSLLPPLSFVADGTAVSGLLEPAYDVGGDTFDYAVDDGLLSFAVFDGMGHGLGAAMLATLAVSTYRHGRREGADLVEMTERMDAALAGQFSHSFVTALTARLDMRTGQLSWHSAGHPAPLLLRGGGPPRELGAPPALPLGLGVHSGDEGAPPQCLQLEPGDRLLVYTDGVVEGRDTAEREFGLARLSRLFVELATPDRLASEVLRRLIEAAHDWQGGQLRDDATLLLVEWAGPSRGALASAGDR